MIKVENLYTIDKETYILHGFERLSIIKVVTPTLLKNHPFFGTLVSC
jgi:hypothetical protein